MAVQKSYFKNKRREKLKIYMMFDLERWDSIFVLNLILIKTYDFHSNIFLYFIHTINN